MPKLIFYRQLRADGGVRTGVDVDGDTVYGIFEEGESDDNPRLRRFVDLRCNGERLPRTGRGARKWLLEHGGAITTGIEHCADEVSAGIDPDVLSYTWSGFEHLAQGVGAKLVMSAARRSDAIEMPEILRDISANWGQIVRSMKPPLARSPR